MKRILLIEDDPDIGELITYHLHKSAFEPHHVTNANDALILLERMTFDALLLDLMLPGLKGLDFLTILRGQERFAALPIIIISALNAESEIIAGINKGADDYLPKPFSMEMLVTKLNALLRRSSGETGERSVFEYGSIKIDNNIRKVFVNGKEVTLTHREYELLKLFVTHPHKIYPREVLLNSLWGYSSDFLTRTIDAHVSTLRKKLGGAGSLIKSVPKTGYGIDD